MLSPALWLIPILLVTLGLCLCNLCPKVVGNYHDDGVYIVTAKALATGQGYRIISLPDPLPQTKYPFLYPYILSWIWRWNPHFPDNVLPMKLLSVASGLLFLAVSYRLMTRFRYAAPGITLGIVAMAAWCPWTVYFSTMVLSEMPYALISVLALYFSEAALDPATERRRDAYLIAAALLSGLAYFVRSIGLMVVVATSIHLFYRREWRRLALFAGLVFIMIGPWVLWTRILAPPPGLNPMELYYVSYTHWISEYIGGYFSVSMMNVFCKNLLYCFGGIVTLSNPIFVYAPLPVNFTIHPGVQAVTVCGVLLLLGLGAILTLRRFHYQPRLLDLYIALYLLCVLIWPWSPLRFLIPVAPFLLLYNVRLTDRLTAAFVKRLPRANLRRLVRMGVAGFAASGLLLNLALSVVVVRETMTAGFPLPPTAASPGGTWKDSSEAAMNWIARNTPADATLAAVFDPMCYLYTDRRAVRGFAINPVESFYSAEPSRHSISSLEEVVANWRRYQVSYLVLIPDAEPLLSGYVKDILANHPAWLTLSYAASTESVLVFRVNQGALQAHAR